MEDQTSQLNVEYFFRKIYELLFGVHGSVNFDAFYAFIAHIWIWITIIGYVVSVLGLAMVIYATLRVFELRKREEHFFHTLVHPPRAGTPNARWQHIENLISTKDESKWREAIIEADIMLDDVLTKRGYEGKDVSEKLKSANPDHFRTLSDAWEAHKVRNRIAHDGSTYPLSESIANRTIARYQSVFSEFDAL